MNSYVFGGGEESKTFGPLPGGDYNYVVSEFQEPYQKENGNWVLQVRLSILPNGETVFAAPWSGEDRNGNQRDGIGEFLLSCGRAPKVGQEPVWTQVVGARGRCRLKVEIAQQGALAGKEVNRVERFHRPKQLEPQSYTKEQAEQARAQAQQKARGADADFEPGEIPF